MGTRYHRPVRLAADPTTATARRLTIEALVLAVVALAPMPLPAAATLLVVASGSLALGRERFAPLGPSRHLMVGGLLGVVAAVLCVVVGGPAVSTLVGAPVVFSETPIVRGNAAAFGVVALVTAALAAGRELAMRGWLLPHLGRVGVPPVVALALVALVEAATVPGPWSVRFGVAVLGIGSGLLAQARRGALALPLAAAMTMQVTLVAVEALRLRG